MEAYEYTAKNLAYALGVEGADLVIENTVTTTLSVAVDGGSPGSDDFTVVSATGITVGKFVMLKADNEDDFIVRRVTNVAGMVITVDRPLPDLPSGTVVKVVNKIDIGSKDDQPFYAAKIAGKLANGDEIVILIPKMRIVRGFNLAFTTDDFGNLPIEFTVYDLVSTDIFYTAFDGAQAQIFKV
jgi:hypothetical protein